MALNLSSNPSFTGRITAPDANYPYGSSKDETAPGAGDGSPYLKARADDIFGFQQALLNSTAIVPSGNADTVVASQYLQAIVALASGRADYATDSGVADAYVLALPSGVLAPPALFDGLEVSFFATANNATTTPTADAYGLGAKTIVREDGSALVAGDITTDVMTTLKRDQSGDRWLLTRGAGLSIGLGEAQTWQDVSASRSSGVVYTNTTGRPIMVVITGGVDSGEVGQLKIDGLLIGQLNKAVSSAIQIPITAVVPDGSTYEFTISAGGGIIEWTELR